MSKILGMDLTNKDETVVAVSNSLYVKTPEALATLLCELRAIGFEIDDLRNSAHRKERCTSVETMEKNAWSLWFAHVDVRRGKCNSCEGIIDMRGIQTHGHQCELCGAVTYYEIVDGTKVRFSFIERDEETRAGLRDISLKAKRWDIKEGYLYFYPDVLDGLYLRGSNAEQYFRQHKDKWKVVVEDGQKLVRMKYPYPWDYDVAAIEITDIYSHYMNYQIVKIWEGKEYPEYFGNFPVPDMIHIYEAWHWPRYKKSPTVHRTILEACGQTDDKGWHHQNGSPWFQKGHWESMSVFIRHFTELDADAFDKAWPHFRSDGPGGIDDLAAFCHESAEVTNKPNMWNIVHGYSKALSGQGCHEACCFRSRDAQ
jgi:hypothetical protein